MNLCYLINSFQAIIVDYVNVIKKELDYPRLIQYCVALKLRYTHIYTHMYTITFIGNR